MQQKPEKTHTSPTFQVNPKATHMHITETRRTQEEAKVGQLEGGLNLEYSLLSTHRYTGRGQNLCWLEMVEETLYLCKLRVTPKNPGSKNEKNIYMSRGISSYSLQGKRQRNINRHIKRTSNLPPQKKNCQ